MPIYGDRIRQIRKLRRLTQTKLADLAGIKQAAVSQFEAGVAQPSPRVLSAISRVLDFPEEYFCRPLAYDFPLGSLVFRGKRTATRTKMDIEEAHSWAEVVFECAVTLASKLEPLPISIPELHGESPAAAACIARTALGLSPDRPIPNVTHSFESHGVFVLALPVALVGRDAFSAWTSNPRIPVMVVPSGAPGDRLRFSISHESDHLIRYPSYRGYMKEIETAADQFASEFLMPEQGIRDELPSPVTLTSLWPLKKRWGVSVQSLVIRCRELGVISTRRTQQMFKALSQRGQRLREPPHLDIRAEKPRALRKMIEIIYGNPPDARKFARDFALPPHLAAAIIAVHAERSEVVPSVPVDGEIDDSNVLRFAPRATDSSPA